MARKRSCTAEFYQHRDLGLLGHVTRDFYRSSWTFFSCEGRLALDPQWLADRIYWYDQPKMDGQAVAGMIFTLVMNEIYTLYEVSGGYVLWIPSFKENQKTSHPTHCDIPGAEGGRIITDEVEVRQVLVDALKAPTKFKFTPKAPRDTEGAKAVLAYLNERCGRSFRDTAANIDAIAGWLSKGHDQDDLKMVIDHKWREWGGKEEMQKFLRPSTLFGSKFPGYLEEALEAESRPEEPLEYMADGAGRT